MQNNGRNSMNNIFVGLTSTDYCYLPSSTIARLCENEQPKHQSAISGDKDWRAFEGCGADKNKYKINDF